jgi:hypothetical protein
MDRINALVKPLFVWTLIALGMSLLSRGSRSSDQPVRLVHAFYHHGYIELGFSSLSGLERLRSSNFEIRASVPLALQALKFKSPGALQIQVSGDFQDAFSGTYNPGTSLRSPPQLIFHAPNSEFMDSSVYIEADEREIGFYQGKLFQDSSDLKPYFGQLHAHTEMSDGKKKPETAFETAMSHGLDFYALTDHMEYLDLDPDKWKKEKAEADRYDDPGHFVAFYGFEWSGYAEGLTQWMNHLNVINSTSIFNAFDTSHLTKIFKKMSQLDDSSFGIFNHPGYKHYLLFKIDNWHDFAYSGAADINMKLIRVEGAEQPHSFKIGYVPALDQGWHLGPEYDEDTHSGHFANSPQRTGVWAAQLDRANLVSAFRAMATFYTADPTASLKLTADSRWLMGSTLKGPGRHHLSATFNSSQGAKVKQVDWFTYRGQLIAQDLSGAPHSAIDVDPAQDTYYFVQVIEENGARLISAPIFIDR